MTGFGKQAGPTASSSSQPRFGPPQPPAVFTQLAPRGPEAVQRPRSLPVAYQSPGFAASHYQSTGVPRRPEVLQGVHSSPLAFESSASPPYPSVAPKRPHASSLRWVNEHRPFFKDDAQTNAKPSVVTSFVASRNSATSMTAMVARSQDQEKARSPPLLSAYEDLSRNYSQTFPRMHAQTSSTLDNLPRSPVNYSDLLTQEDKSSVLPYVGYHEIGRNLRGNVTDVHTQTQTQSLPIKEVLHEKSSFDQREYKRPSLSPPTLGVRSNAPLTASDSQILQKHLQSSTHSAEAFPTRSVSLLVTKRARSPPLPSVDRVSEGNSYSDQDGADREIQAKAKRMARFRVELGNMENSSDIAEKKLPRHEQSTAARKIFSSDYSTESAGDFADGNTSSDFEGLETSSIIIGLCPDMCPESERAERERKGDLDQYERLDGDRNQTDKSLAVKKYSRTAEREATLIRPMPILQKTIDYLLGLLDQPYDDRFLGIYNFLWDRMRAIRLDLRMQHIFNLDAICMLEQMIRLHVIAMHELCEYNRGEGFSEGFDAHLNIEQMNKTSVELFQMYNDHRKKGLNVLTEKEFRGYYALLKLDKHPGYKVEPSELSLDLAKMTPEIRQTSEVLFARDVARACRAGNFIAFFRLARKASYLQACLMHAHFAKLRTQALASLHIGLQNNQGLPVACVAEWLGMEGEDIYSLLEYYGFLIKEFEEPYMVKEGPFLNGDKDYPTKCSKLVHLKKSMRIVEDVSPPQHQASLPVRATKEVRLPKIHKPVTKSGPSALVEGKISDPNSDQESFPNFLQVQPRMEQSVVNQHRAHNMASVYASPWSFSSPHISSASQPTKFDSAEKISPVGLSSSHSSSATQPTKLGDVEKISPWGFSSPHSSFASQSTKLGAVEKISPRGFASPHSPSASQQANSGAVEKILPWGYSSAHGSLAPQPVKFGIVEKDRSSPPGAYHKRGILSGMQAEPLQIVSRAGFPEKGLSDKDGLVVDNSIHQIEAFDHSKDEELPDVNQANENDEVIENYKDEVAQAKLKLIIRLWKRRASKLKNLNKQRQIAADAALSSMLLGPPIRQAENQSTAATGFDIDHVVRERFEKHDQSWSRLNVSDVIMDVLRRRNPDCKCLCWKIILCSQINTRERDKLSHRNRIMPVSAGPWLVSKLMPSGKDNDTENEDMLISSPGLAIWRKWISSEPGSNLTCCLSVVKDVDFNHLDETVAGASAIVFLVSESIPWNLQKIQLHNLLTSIPSGSYLPLLILSGSYNRELSDASSVIISKLGLLKLDKLKISDFLVLFLGEKRTSDSDGFFSDLKLREGLRWLANESPLHPDLHCTKMRDLILTCLNPSLDVLENMNDYEVGPDDCISAFNEALDWSMGEIEAAALANPASWPCPEIALLGDSCHEHTVAQLYMPGTGWSSATRIARLLSAVRDCKLPSFPDTESWLAKSASVGKGIEKLILELETSLIRYMTESSKMMGFPLAAKEANLMLQRSSRLELCDSSYRVVPKWVMLFRRVFSWRLTRLSGGPFSSIYILRTHNAKLTPPVRDELGLEASASSPYLTKPTLDEVIDAGCWILQAERDRSPAEAFQPSHRTRSGSEGEVFMVSNTDDPRVNERNLENCDNLSDMKNMDHLTNGLKTSGTEIMVSGKATNGAEKLSNGMRTSSTQTVVSGKATDGAERLSKLLEQCNIVQNSIDAKLSIYF